MMPLVPIILLLLLIVVMLALIGGMIERGFKRLTDDAYDRNDYRNRQ
jgi:hypothetical protein